MSTGKLTREHVFGSWLSRIGLPLEPTMHRAGLLNRIGQELGVRPPFRQTVRDVCGDCNNGWMSQLEVIAQRILPPFILGEAGTIVAADSGMVAMWAQKTALMAMLILSQENRNAGYGFPSSEYHGLWMLRNELQPLPASQFWIGRYTGRRRASARVTPLVVTAEGLPEPDRPQGYVMTIQIGQLVLQGMRFTTPSLVVEVATQQELPQLWPTAEPVVYPGGTLVDDAAFLNFAGGKNLRSTEPYIEIRPWKPATELAASRHLGSKVELPTICGKHVVYYPTDLVNEAMCGRFYIFGTKCECPIAYLIQTEPDGAHCKNAGTVEAISELYESLPGEEILIEDEHGVFPCKQLTASDPTQG
ncbi:MAG: hypothetical protein ACREP9_23625 [Candidatus Dormibacteraceae bacterium]